MEKSKYTDNFIPLSWALKRNGRAYLSKIKSTGKARILFSNL